MKLFSKHEHNKSYLNSGMVSWNFLQKEKVKELLGLFKGLKPNDKYAPKNRPSDYHCTFLDSNVDYKRSVFNICQQEFQPTIDALLPNYDIWSANLYVKPPKTGVFTIHQNWTHVLDERDTTFTIWCPLVDTSKSNGTLELVPKSHKIVPDIATLNLPYYFHGFEDELKLKHLVPQQMKAGQGLIFEDGIIHYSSVNTSAKSRYAVQILIGPRHLRPVYYYYDIEKPEKGFEIFEIDEEFWIQNSYETMNDRPSKYKSLGYRANTNRLLSEKEFLLAMEKGNQRRALIYG